MTISRAISGEDVPWAPQRLLPRYTSKVMIPCDFTLIYVRIGHTNLKTPKEAKIFQLLGRWPRIGSFAL